MQANITPLTSSRRRTLKNLACFAVLAICLFNARKVNLSGWAVSDYSAYWSASKLLLAGHNPYDSDAVFAMQKTIGWKGTMPLVMRNPPWAFPFVLPLGFFSLSLSRILWMIPQTAVLIGGAMWLWKLYGGSASQRWVAWLVSLSFLPALWVLAMGQITPLIFLGVIGFLFCERQGRSNSWLQAVSLVLIALKPQLLYLFWIALPLWIFTGKEKAALSPFHPRRWTLPIKFFAALAVATAIPLAIDRHICAEYLRYIRETPILKEPIPTLGNWLLLNSHLRWTQFAPMVCGAIWLGWHWRKHRHNWTWPEQMPALLLVSVLTTSYSWFFDQIVLLPALLFAMAQNFPSRSRAHTATALLLYLSVNAGVLAVFYHEARLTNFGFLWTAPAWCLLFVALRWLARGTPKQSQSGLNTSAETEQPVSYASNLAA